MIYFKDIVDNRISRTIIGKPSSTDVSIFSDEDHYDYFCGEKMTVEDCDQGLIYLSDVNRYVKINNLENFEGIGIDVDDLHECITSKDLVFGK